MDLRVKTVNYFKGLMKTAKETDRRMVGDDAAAKKDAHAGGLFSPRGEASTEGKGKSQESAAGAKRKR